jgi:hypothetical protein
MRSLGFLIDGCSPADNDSGVHHGGAAPLVDQVASGARRCARAPLSCLWQHSGAGQGARAVPNDVTCQNSAQRWTHACCKLKMLTIARQLPLPRVFGTRLAEVPFLGGCGWHRTPTELPGPLGAGKLDSNHQSLARHACLAWQPSVPLLNTRPPRMPIAATREGFKRAGHCKRLLSVSSRERGPPHGRRGL